MEWLLILGILYFIPAMVAAGRNHPSQAGITILNIFLGWTFVGWVVALVWAVSAKPSEVVPPARAVELSPTPTPVRVPNHVSEHKSDSEVPLPELNLEMLNAEPIVTPPPSKPNWVDQARAELAAERQGKR